MDLQISQSFYDCFCLLFLEIKISWIPLQNNPTIIAFAINDYDSWFSGTRRFWNYSTKRPVTTSSRDDIPAKWYTTSCWVVSRPASNWVPITPRSIPPITSERNRPNTCRCMWGRVPPGPGCRSVQRTLRRCGCWNSLSGYRTPPPTGSWWRSTWSSAGPCLFMGKF